MLIGVSVLGAIEAGDLRKGACAARHEAEQYVKCGVCTENLNPDIVVMKAAKD